MPEEEVGNPPDTGFDGTRFVLARLGRTKRGDSQRSFINTLVLQSGYDFLLSFHSFL